MKYSLILISVFLVTPAYSMPSNDVKGKDKEITVEIATDGPTSLAAPRPSFSESVATELMEKVQELDARVEKLEKAVAGAEQAK